MRKINCSDTLLHHGDSTQQFEWTLKINFFQGIGFSFFNFEGRIKHFRIYKNPNVASLMKNRNSIWAAWNHVTNGVMNNPLRYDLEKFFS